MKLIIIIFLLFIIKLNLVLSLKLVINIEIKSNLSYENYECGGSFQFINGEQVNNKTIPPCKSFNDAGNRARQYQGKNTSVLFLLQNYDGSQITEGPALGLIKGFCLVEIESTIPNQIINIKGGTLYFPDRFIFYSYNYTLDSENCSQFNSSIRVIFKNLNFRNFYYGVFYFANMENSINNFSKEKLKYYFSSITVQNSIEFLYLVNYQNYNYEKHYFYVDNCVISNTKSTNKGIMTSFYPMYINNTIFKNIITENPIIYEFNNSSLIIENSNFTNIFIANVASIVYNYLAYTIMNNIRIDSCSTYSVFFSYLQPKINSLNKFTNIIIDGNNEFLDYNYTNNNFITTKKRNGLFIFVSDSNNDNIYGIEIENLTLTNYQIENTKPFIYGELFNYIILKNIYIEKTISSLINSSNTEIIIKGNNNIISNKYINGVYNNISIFDSLNKNINYSDFKYNLEKNCFKCNLNYKIQDDVNNNDNINNNENNKKNGTHKFNKLILIPIIMCPILIIILIVVLKKKQYINVKKTHQNNNIEEMATGESNAIPLNKIN